MTLLSCRNVSKAFGRTPALTRVSLEVARGDIVGLSGPNGAGKSTLLRCISGILRPDSGWIRLAGLDISGAQAYRELKKNFHFSYLGPHSQLYNDLSISENLNLFASLLGVDNPEHCVETVCREFGISRQADKRVCECSQGIVRRAALARCFLGEPKLVLLDEPLANLDAVGRAAAIERFQVANQKGAALLVATHDERLLNQECTRVVHLTKGRLISRFPKFGQRLVGAV